MELRNNPVIILSFQEKMQNKKVLNEKHQGRWSQTEHNAFLKALERHGRNWVLIQKKVKTRNLTQVRSHANKIFKKIPKQDLDAYIGFENSDYEDEQISFPQKKQIVEKQQPTNQLKEKEEKVCSYQGDEKFAQQEMSLALSRRENKEGFQKQEENIANNYLPEQAYLNMPCFYQMTPFQNPSTSINPYELLQSIQMNEYNGNFFLMALNQIAINNMLQASLPCL